MNVPVVLKNLASLERKYKPVRIPKNAHDVIPASHHDANGGDAAVSSYVLGRSFMSGYLYKDVAPIRWASVFNWEKKWICPNWMFADDVFPDYLSGAG